MNNLYLIGLTGNLASGKSTVRRMLEQLGARGLDADALAHLAMRRGTPVWFNLVKTFGLDILTFTGKIDRRKLGARVFSDPNALRQLEAIVHPAVREMLKDWLRNVETPIAVIEAIKLIEAGLHEWCDALWVVQTKPETQIERVVRDRQMTPEDARARLAAQGPIEVKLRLANVVIDNNGDEKLTRAQVERAWAAINPTLARDKRPWLWSLVPLQPEAPIAAPPQPAPATETTPPVVSEPPSPAWAVEPPPKTTPVSGEPPLPTWAVEAPSAMTAIQVRRARRSDLDALSIALGKRENLGTPLPQDQVLKRFGERGYRIALSEGRVIAFAAWEAENLVAIMRETWAESPSAAERALPQLFALIEQDARTLLCEVSLILLEASAAPYISEQARAHGYALRELNALHRLWIPVVQERLRPGDQILAKQLREEIITKPV